MPSAIRTPVQSSYLREHLVAERRARFAFIALAICMTAGPVLTYVWFQWSDVYVYRPGNQPMSSVVTGVVVALSFSLGVGLMLWRATWRGYTFDFVRATLVGGVGAFAGLFLAMLLAL